MHTPFQAFERRLDPYSRAPLAVAFSGGGDSLALLLLTKAWADRAGRPVLALTVDHGLQPGSAAWTRMAAACAQRIGVDFRALTWDGDKPATGVASAARAARHGLIADAARTAGASVILVGHTLDDQLENALMRAAGEGVGLLREWSPSPVWPQGRGLFHFRPLLAVRRSELRGWLADKGLAWIEDPANEDMRSARARARTQLRGDRETVELPPAAADEALRRLAAACRTTPWGTILVPRAALKADIEAARRLVQIAAACAGGRPALGRPERARAVAERLNGEERFVAGLAGARLTAGDDLLITREAGEFRRTGGGVLPLPMGCATVWDGRYELTARREGLSAAPLHGRFSQLQADEKTKLLSIPAPARGALPAILRAGLAPVCPILAGTKRADPDVTVIDLTAHRFRAASGLIAREPESSPIADMAICFQSPYVGAEVKGLME